MAAGMMVLPLAAPHAHELRAGGLGDVYASDPDDQNSNNHVLREDYRPSSRTANGRYQNYHQQSSSSSLSLDAQSRSTSAAGGRSTDGQPPAPPADSYTAVKEMLWLLPGINEIVLNTLGRMEKAFAYNSVFLLRAILDLQSSYISLRPKPDPSCILQRSLVLRIADTLSTRLNAKRDGNRASLSRELYLRTLISALTLLYQRDEGKLDNDNYAKLFRDMSEQDADNVSHHRQKAPGSKLCTGESESLTRYACDLIRSMPSDLGPLLQKDLNSETIHFILAAGFINQRNGYPNTQTLDEVYARITAAPSDWHKDMRNLYEGTSAAISMYWQSKPGGISGPAAALAVDMSKSIMEKVEQELRAYRWNSNPLLQGMIRSGGKGAVVSPRPPLEAQLFVCGLLDLLNQLVSTFPSLDEIVTKGKQLALRLIRRSEERVFRYKAFELIICSTVGYSEKAYFDTMRELETEIEETSRASGYFDTRTDVQKSEASSRAQQLFKEKRQAMERFEERSILFKGAVSSMQRRLQQSHGRGPVAQPSREDIARIGSPWLDEARSDTTASPVPSSQSQPSLVPTLSSNGPSCDSHTNSPTDSPACEGSTLCSSMLSPSQTCTSPTESTSCQTVMSPPPSVFSPPPAMESPILPIQSPRTPAEPHEAVTPGLPLLHDSTFSDFSELTALFSGKGLHLWDDGDESLFTNDEDLPAKDANVQRKLSIELPIQTFDSEDIEPERAPAQMPRELPFRKRMSEQSMERVPEEEDEEAADNIPAIAELGESSPVGESPVSMFAEPSLSRKSTNISLKRSSGGRRARPTEQRIRSMRLDKPLPPIVVPEQNKRSVRPEDAPEPVEPNKPPVKVVREPPRSQSAMEIRRENIDAIRRMSSSSSLGMRPNDYRGFTPMTPILDTGYESSTSRPVGPMADYSEQPKEVPWKVSVKDSCFKTAISSDIRNAVFLSPHSFQVFRIPAPNDGLLKKPVLAYRLGDHEKAERKKADKCEKDKCGKERLKNMTYRGVAASDRYLVTISSQQLQVHDLNNNGAVVFTDFIRGWEFSCVTISADKLAVGLRMNLKSESAGMVRIYRLNSPTNSFERWGKDIHLPINPRDQQDAPHLITLSADGYHLTIGTSNCGYYFAWNIARIGAPRLVANGRLKKYEGTGGGTLTGAMLFPDAQHMFCSTFPITSEGPVWGGGFTEPVSSHQQSATHTHRPIRQVSTRINTAALAPHGDGASFLSKNGTVWTTPMVLLDDDNNVTSLAPVKSKERLQVQANPDANGATVRFSPGGERLIGVDRKGKILCLNFPTKIMGPNGLPSAGLSTGGLPTASTGYFLSLRLPDAAGA